MSAGVAEAAAISSHLVSEQNEKNIPLSPPWLLIHFMLAVTHITNSVRVVSYNITH